MKRCFFIGHRDAPQEVYTALCEAVEEHICQGVEEFLVGGYGAFDHMAAKAVMEMKKRYSAVRLVRLLAYLPTVTAAVPEGFDGSLYPEGLENTPRPFAIVKANQMAVDMSDSLIGYVCYAPSNAAKVVRRAQKKGLRVTLLPPPG
ncbi:MAG: hypothetical protein E7541_02765 [Ruminococcaceae bacterium]|nr:hypothetical protein [Oscillospiraceae bacterium]